MPAAHVGLQVFDHLVPLPYAEVLFQCHHDIDLYSRLESVPKLT